MSSTLAVSPTLYIFGPQSEAKFRQHISVVSDRTRLVPIEDPEDIELDDQARTRKGGYQLSYLAFTQLGSTVASGLVTIAEDVSGLRSRVARSTDLALACRIINQVAALRFFNDKSLLGKQMVLDTETNVIDGIIGGGYRYLRHLDLLDFAESMLHGLDHPVHFSGAHVLGRRLSLCMLSNQPVFQIPGTKDVFYAGYYFTNSEAGECSVGAASMLGVPDATLRCIGGLTGAGQIKHTGRNFSKKLGQLLSRVLVSPDWATTLGQRVGELLERPLRLVRDDLELNEAKASRLVEQLHGSGITKPIAEDVMQWATWAGARRKQLPDARDLEDVANRSAFDIFVALMRRGGEYHPSIREVLEQVAYQLLLGHVNVG